MRMVGRYRALLTELGVIIVSEEDGAGCKDLCL